MALLRAEIGYLQLPYLNEVVGQEIITADETFNYLPFKNLNGTNVHRFNRELTVGTNTTSSVVLPSGTWTESSPTYTNVEDTIKIFGDSAYVPKMSSGDPQVVAQVIAAKSKAVARSWAKMLIKGSGTDPQPQGLYYIVSGSTREEAVASVGSGSISLTKLDTLIANVDAGPATFLMCNTTQRNNIMNAIRGAGSLPNFSTERNLGAGPVLLYNGIPVLVNDWITTDTTNTVGASSRIYAIYANELDGFTGFYNGSAIFDVSDGIEVTQGDMLEYKVVMRAGFSYISSHAIYALYGCL
jgi:hypothetical protein